MNLIPTDDREWAELGRYLSGELSETEAARLEREAAADPSRAARLDQARLLWATAGQAADGWDAPSALAAIKARAGKNGALAVRRPGPRFQVDHGSSWLRGAIAASVILAGGLWYAHRGAVAPVEPEASPMAEITTLPGQRADLLLPDGSRVSLGMASRLRYPVRAGGASRDLYLDGEAYFEVVTDAARPLRVHTRRGVTEDIGTAFSIRAYGGGPLDVVVTEGVAVLRATPTDSVLLGPADLGRVAPDGRLTRTPDVDVENYLAWRNDRLVFYHTPLPEVLERLRAWYGIDIELGDSSLAGADFIGTYEQAPAKTVLDELAVALGLRYEHRGALTLVYPRRPPPR
jgi:transmembrane sensor